MPSAEPLLEVIACSVADAIAAQQGGAGRLEVIRDLSSGGLTPSFELVLKIIAVVSIPVRVMLRESVGYEVSSEDERDLLCKAARQFSTLDIDGVVLGFLRSGRIDVKLTQDILHCAPSLRATFHHAFEEANPAEAIREIKQIKQVDRLLTHGGVGSWSERIKSLVRYRELAGPEIQIIAGGGLDAQRITDIAGKTEIREFHVGRAARVNCGVDGAVTAAQVEELVAAVKSL
jgi:copper homeostasis protein